MNTSRPCFTAACILVVLATAGCQLVRDRGDKSATTTATTMPEPEPTPLPEPPPAPPSPPTPPPTAVAIAPEDLQSGLAAAHARLARNERWSLPPEQTGYYVDVLHARLLSLAASGIEATRRGNDIVVRVGISSWFESGSTDLTPDARTELAPLLDVLREFDKSLVCVIGHTDDQGTDAVNQQLSRQRAQSVARTVINAGVPAARVVVVGFGEARPVAANDDADGRERNRRVEFQLTPIVR